MISIIDIMKSKVRLTPGIIPATNSWPIDVLVRAPKMMRLTLGGMSIPKVAAEAIVPRTSFSLYLRLRNSGNATVEIVAAVATEEPDTAAKTALACTRDLAETRRCLSTGELPLRERLGSALLGAKVTMTELVRQWGFGGGGEMTKAEFRKHLAKLLNEEGKPDAQVRSFPETSVFGSYVFLVQAHLRAERRRRA